MITIYHNPRCSKSRETLSLVQEFATCRQLPVEVVEYLQNPLGLDQLATLQRMLGCKANAMARSNEDEFSSLGLEQADDDTILRAIADYPRLLQRPIVVFRGRAAIGRPPELVRELLAAGDEQG